MAKEKCPDCGNENNQVSEYKKGEKGLAIYWCNYCNQSYFKYIDKSEDSKP